jgi:O-antigen/teichoic acid export membrane protein
MLFTLMMPIFTVANNLRIAFVVKKMFPQYRCEGHIPAEMLADLKKRVCGTMISTVTRMSRNSFDSICISAFIGLTMTAMYNNYYYIINAVTSMITVFSSSLKGGIGNHVALKSCEENFNELRQLDFVYMNVSGWCAAFILCLIQPFMELWMGKDMILPFAVVILLCIYFYCLKIGDMRSLYVTATGLWWENRYRSITEAVLNIILNIVLAKFFGLYGIIMATILTMFFIHHLWGSQIAFKLYFGFSKIKTYWLYQLKYFLINTLICIVTYSVCCLINTDGALKTLCIRFMICLVIPGLIYLVIYSRTKYFKEAVNIVFKRNG